MIVAGKAQGAIHICVALRAVVHCDLDVGFHFRFEGQAAVLILDPPASEAKHLYAAKQ